MEWLKGQRKVVELLTLQSLATSGSWILSGAENSEGKADKRTWKPQGVAVIARDTQGRQEGRRREGGKGGRERERGLSFHYLLIPRVEGITLYNNCLFIHLFSSVLPNGKTN